MPDSPAAKAGIQAGDKIVRLDGKDNPDWEDIITREIESAQRPSDGHASSAMASAFFRFRDSGSRR
jgi:C-terminal processing protease CtpA/Prc